MAKSSQSGKLSKKEKKLNKIQKQLDKLVKQRRKAVKKIHSLFDAKEEKLIKKLTKVEKKIGKRTTGLNALHDDASSGNPPDKDTENFEVSMHVQPTTKPKIKAPKKTKGAKAKRTKNAAAARAGAFANDLES